MLLPKRAEKQARITTKRYKLDLEALLAGKDGQKISKRCFFNFLQENWLIFDMFHKIILSF